MPVTLEQATAILELRDRSFVACDAKFSGTNRELDEATESLSAVERTATAGSNTRALYGLEI